MCVRVVPFATSISESERSSWGDEVNKGLDAFHLRKCSSSAQSVANPKIDVQHARRTLSPELTQFVIVVSEKDLWS